MSNLHFALAATQGETRVMRLQMLPFSIGHKVMLDAISSPFLKPGVTPSHTALIQAALICSRTYQENQDERGGLIYRAKIHLWLQRCESLRWDREIEKLRRHIALGCLCPRVKPEGGRAPGSVWAIRLHQFLTMIRKLSDADAWNYRYGQAQFEWCAYWESEGSLKVWNAQDQEFEDFCNQQDAMAAAEAKK